MRRRQRLFRLLLNAATIMSLTVFGIAVAAWAYCSFRDTNPHAVRMPGVRRHDGIEWRVFYVLRPRPSHAALERWEVPRPDDGAFAGDLLASRNWGIHSFANADTNLGVVSWTDYRAGIAQVATPKAVRRSRGITTVPVRGHTSVAIRWWFFALLALTPALARVGNRVRERIRVPAGHCRACGYDLRATPDRCPECGSIPAR